MIVLSAGAAGISCEWRGRQDQNPFCERMVGQLATSASTTTTTTSQATTVAFDKVATLSDQQISNWSGTHLSEPSTIYEPRNAEEVVSVLQACSQCGHKIRPVGSALSPNGLGMNGKTGNLLSVSDIDYVHCDKESRLVTVGAGATVHKVLKELLKHDLTLENFSSIQEQQIAGWTQVAAHGTGCGLPSVEEQIVKMKMATCEKGVLALSNEENPELFKFAKVGLGCLGVVTELTLRCIPRMSLHEKTNMYTKKSIGGQEHLKRLRENRHVRYMWVPYTDAVLSVTSNPVPSTTPLLQISKHDVDHRKNPLAELYSELKKVPYNEAASKGFGELRDVLLDMNPLDTTHVKTVNTAEAGYWKSTEGERIADSTDVLGFDCGGQQLVVEVCFPIGEATTTGHNETKDIDFVKELITSLEKAGVAAPSPIEQRWTARSTAPMSPCYSENERDIFCWVGIIMYLPAGQTPEDRENIRRSFEEYKVGVLGPLMKKYNARTHWAKIELPYYETERHRIFAMRKSLRRDYPIDEFNRWRMILDPNNILTNDTLDQLFR